VNVNGMGVDRDRGPPKKLKKKLKIKNYKKQKKYYHSVLYGRYRYNTELRIKNTKRQKVRYLCFL
jgi:hypothetical protein